MKLTHTLTRTSVVFDDPNLVSFAGMVAGADSIDDMALLRHGGASRLFARAYTPSPLGSFLRAFTFGHVRQLDAVAARFLAALAARAGLLRNRADASGRPAAG